MKKTIEKIKLFYALLMVLMLALFGVSGIIIDICLSVLMIPIALVIKFLEKHPNGLE